MSFEEHPFLPSGNSILCTLAGHTNLVSRIKFTNDGSYLLSASADRRIGLFNPYNGRCVCFYENGHNGAVRDISVTDNKYKFYSVGTDNYGLEWDVKQKRVVRKFESHIAALTSCHLKDDETVFITGSEDKCVSVWDVRTRGPPVMVLDDARDSITSVDASANSIKTGSIDGILREYDIRQGKLSELDFGSPISAFCTNHKKDEVNLTLVSLLDSTIRLIDDHDDGIKNGSIEPTSSSCGRKQINFYTGHLNKELSLHSTFDITDGYIVSGSENGDIVYWDLADSEQKKVFYNISNIPIDIAFAPKPIISDLGIHEGVRPFPVMASAMQDGKIIVFGEPLKETTTSALFRGKDH